MHQQHRRAFAHALVRDADAVTGGGIFSHSLTPICPHAGKPAIGHLPPPMAPPCGRRKPAIDLSYRVQRCLMTAARNRIWLGIAAINGALAVMAGAFAAHGLKAMLAAQSLSVFETGARYHMYHALAMALAALILAPRAAGSVPGPESILFSGSLYLLAPDLPAHIGQVVTLPGRALFHQPDGRLWPGGLSRRLI